MGLTFAQSFLRSHIIRPNELIVLEHDIEKHQSIRNRGIINIISEADEIDNDVDFIVLAVKPQDCEKLFPIMREKLNGDQLVLSIMAGMSISRISDALGISKIIRSMPNLPSQIGLGMAGFTASPLVSRSELIEVQNLLGTTGKTIYFEDESMLDAVTAISGSGPAYVFYFMDAMMKAAIAMGFSEAQAELLVWQTFMGSVNLQNQFKYSCDEWIDMVKSKGGTTEAALKHFDKSNFKGTIEDAMFAALNRAKELGT